MKEIILVQNRRDGEWLRREFSQFDRAIGELGVLTRDDVLKDSSLSRNTERIFSTWYMPVFTDEEVRVLFPKLKEVFYGAGTVNYFAEPFLKNGVRVFSAAKANGTPVAEFVVAQIILANKGYFQAQRNYKSLLWKWNFLRSRRFAESHAGNYDAKVGLIGFGAVGSQVAMLLKPYHVSVYAYDPYVKDEVFSEAGIERMELDEIFKKCDVITNHLPDIPSTRGMLNARFFSQMKDNVTFINTGRGAQIVERDLSRAIRKRKNACAVLDVTRHEPVFPWSPLLWNKNVFISPHIAGSLSQEKRRLVEQMVAAAKMIDEGMTCEYEVKLSQLEKQSR